MGFPDNKYFDAADYASAYFNYFAKAAATVSRDSLRQAAELLSALYKRGDTLFVCGNGGSATISDSFVCDHTKLIASGTSVVPRVISLASNTAMLTAIGNDMSYADIFAYQLSALARPNDILLVISASGNSENVVRAAEFARKHGLKVIALTGFDGGRMAKVADCNIHIDADNYGVIEDVCQSCMHILAQYIRQCLMEPAAIQATVF